MHSRSRVRMPLSEQPLPDDRLEQRQARLRTKKRETGLPEGGEARPILECRVCGCARVLVTDNASKTARTHIHART